MALIDKLTAIADAIRGKTGGTDALTLDQMAMEIAGIETGGGGEDTLTAMLTNTLTEYSNDSMAKVPAYAFYGCASLERISFPVATAVQDSVFKDCTKLATVNMPELLNFGFSGFEGCKSLEIVDFPKAPSTGYSTFAGCTKLKSVNMPLVTAIKNGVFNSTALESVAFPLVTAVESVAFKSCTALVKADFPKLTQINGYAFQSCTALKAFILRGETMCTLGSTNGFVGSSIASGTGYIYVPSALLESYKAATNWSTYADQFRALEDYTVDGTTTGELDESKI